MPAKQDAAKIDVAEFFNGTRVKRLSASDFHRRPISPAQIKRLTGGDPVDVRHVRQCINWNWFCSIGKSGFSYFDSKSGRIFHKPSKRQFDVFLAKIMTRFECPVDGLAGRRTFGREITEIIKAENASNGYAFDIADQANDRLVGCFMFRVESEFIDIQNGQMVTVQGGDVAQDIEGQSRGLQIGEDESNGFAAIHYADSRFAHQRFCFGSGGGVAFVKHGLTFSDDVSAASFGTGAGGTSSPARKGGDV